MLNILQALVGPFYLYQFLPGSQQSYTIAVVVVVVVPTVRMKSMDSRKFPKEKREDLGSNSKICLLSH